MTAYEKAHGIIAERLRYTINESAENAATGILRELAMAHLKVVRTKSTDKFRTRFGAHARLVGEETGYGYQYMHDEAIKYAMEFEEWPYVEESVSIEVAGETIIVPYKRPLFCVHQANNKQLKRAYEFIVETAAEHKIYLPETGDDEIGG